MTDFWAYGDGEKLCFAYRARRFVAGTPPMTSAELTAVAAAAFDEFGSPIALTQPTYVAALQAYVGWILPAALVGKKFVSISATATVAPGIPQAWAPKRFMDTHVNQGLAAVLGQLQGIATTPGRGGARYDG